MRPIRNSENTQMMNRSRHDIFLFTANYLKCIGTNDSNGFVYNFSKVIVQFFQKNFPNIRVYSNYGHRQNFLFSTRPPRRSKKKNKNKFHLSIECSDAEVSNVKNKNS